MRWEDERYVRVYTRDTVDWLALSFEAQGLFTLLLRKVDRAGILTLGRRGKQAVAVAVGHAARWATLGPALEELISDGCVVVDSERLIVRNFLEAQEARQSDKARQQRARELARAVTKRDISSQNVTESHTPSHAVTDGHTASHAVTPSRAVPSCAEPAVPSLSGADAPATESREPFELRHPEPKRRTRRPSVAETLYSRLEEDRATASAGAGVPYTPERWAHSRQNRVLGPIAKQAKENADAADLFQAAWHRYLDTPGNASKQPPFSLQFFLSSISTWESLAKQGRASA
jgi:hypothetical protein